MKIKMTAGSYVRSSEHLLEMKSGGGCVSLFGLPFFFAGLFMILISTGVIPLSNGDDVPFWGMLIIACMGLIFSAVGGGLVFARQWHTIDRRQMRLWISKGLMKPMHSSFYDLHDFDEVRIRYVKGDSDTADRYPLVLISTKGIPELELCTATGYGQARSQAILIGEFLGFGISDASTDNLQSLEGPAKPLQKTDLPPYPAREDFELKEGPDGLYLGLLPGRMHKARLLFGCLPLLFFLLFARGFVGILWSAGTPAVVRIGFLSFFGFFFVLLPLLEMLRGRMRTGKAVQTLKISNSGLELKDRLAKKSLNLRWDQVFGVDLSSPETKLRSAADGQTGVDPTSIPRWIPKLVRYVGAGALIIKAADELHYIGSGLPEDQLVYLHAVISNALQDYRPALESGLPQMEQSPENM